MANKHSHYLTDIDDTGERRVLSIRVPVDLLDQFRAATEIARKYGKRLDVSMVVRTALREAVDEVAEMAASHGPRVGDTVVAESVASVG